MHQPPGVRMNDVQCPTCGADVAPTTFCVRCGARLVAESRKRGYAAFPDERRVAPWITSSIFPQLPRTSIHGFRLALALGAVLVVGALLAGAYTIAIVLAAMMVPTLTVIYVYDVNVYEDAPIKVTALTILWGVGAGALVAVAARLAVPTSADLLSRSTTESVVIEGVAIPVIGFALVLFGPLVLFFDGRFDDVLDGVAFGVASGAFFASTQALVSSASFVDDGLRPGGSTRDWALRVTVLLVAGPLLWAGVAGAVMASAWLRYRVRDSDGRRLRLARPALAFVLGAAAIVGASCAQLVLPIELAALVAGGLAAAALVWLRACIHRGLVHEGRKGAVGPATSCANCRVETPLHTFCGNCGVARRALPKAPRPGIDGAIDLVGGFSPARVVNRLVPLVSTASLLVVSGVAAVAIVLFEPTAEASTCEPGEPCGGPPSAAPLLERGATWPGNDVTLVYNPVRWHALESRPDRLVLTRDDGSAWIEILPTSERTAKAAIAAERLPAKVRAVERLDMPLHEPGLGYVDGDGAWYAGFLDSPQGPRDSITVAALAARRLGTTVHATAVFFATSEELFADSGRRALRGEVDSILNTMRWSSGVQRSPAAALVDPHAASAPPGNEVASLASSPTRAARGLLPKDIAAAYEVQPLWDAGMRGQGQTVAVVSLDTFRDEDIEQFDRLAGITDAPMVEKRTVYGQPVELGSGALEVSLDIEIIRGLVPRAEIVSYEAPLGWQGFVDALHTINDDGRADVVSISWGKCLPLVKPEIVGAMEHELAVAAQAGRTVVVASGDAGAFSCLHSESELEARNHVPSVDWPAASPNVLAVGGTRLARRSDGSYYAENAWEDSLSNRGSGGGVSPAHRRPRWQFGVGERNAYSTGGRQVPDVAGPADCDTAFLVVYPRRVDGSWRQVTAPVGCGTSAAAPFWAAVAALARQYVEAKAFGELGFLPPALYALAATPSSRAFRDIRTGGNLDVDATRGWDYATGLGTPRVWTLVDELAQLARRVRP